ncbi:hypothetical protein KDA14_02175, partial [Candidatus Saccharibacteria bacterium]|nr:hypothetical protein [Candidatus Saccharibacteria bacterium]
NKKLTFDFATWSEELLSDGAGVYGGTPGQDDVIVSTSEMHTASDHSGFSVVSETVVGEDTISGQMKSIFAFAFGDLTMTDLVGYLTIVVLLCVILYSLYLTTYPILRMITRRRINNIYFVEDSDMGGSSPTEKKKKQH